MRTRRSVKAPALNTFTLEPQAGEVPEWVPLVPAGEVRGRDGRRWYNSAPEGIIAHFAELGRDLPVDIEHSTEHKAPKGEPAPAVAWVKGLRIHGGEIWGRVEWTADGKRQIMDKAYRYLSPVILYERESGIIAGITSVGLTNQPNLRLPALNHQQEGEQIPPKENGMKNILSALALGEGATEDEAVAKVQALQSELAAAVNQAQTPDLARFVPRADFDAMRQRAVNAEQTLEQQRKEQEEAAINAALDKACEEGKITPASREYHYAQCRQDGGLERFAEYCRTAAPIADRSGLDDKNPGDSGEKALNSCEQKICQLLGIDEKAFK